MAFGISYYLFPIISAVVWLGTLLGLLIWWVVNGEQHFPSMDPTQRIAYISDVGAQELKPLFIAGSAVTTVCFDAVFIFEKWLRHLGRLAPHTSKSEKAFSFLSAIFSIVGAAGLILLSIFDTLRHPRLHDVFLVVFIVGYLLTAIFVCAEYQRLGMHQRQFRLLRASFWLKLSWVIVFLGLAIGFGVENKRSAWNTAAILEWAIAFLFAFFVASFAIDFLPAIQTRHHHNRFSHRGDAEKGHHSTGTNQLGGPARYSSDEGSYASNRPIGQNSAPYQATPSRNF